MNKKDLTFGGTFCVLPWIEEYANLAGQRQFCCWSEEIITDDNHATLLREKIWNKERISHCKSCYQLEDNKSVS